MDIRVRHLMGATLRTKSGQQLGRVADVVLDATSGRLVSLFVRTRGLVAGLTGDALHIAWSQVISLSEKEVVVVDGTVTESARGTRATYLPRSSEDAVS